MTTNDKKRYEDMTAEEKFLERITWNDDDIIITKQAIDVPDDGEEVIESDGEPAVSYRIPRKPL